MNTEEKLQVLAALLEENCSTVRIKDGCMLFQGKKALFGILLLKTIYRDDDNKITSFRMSMSRSRQKERFNLCVDCLDLVTCSTV